MINLNELRASLRNYWKSENHELKFVIRHFLYSFLNFRNGYFFIQIGIEFQILASVYLIDLWVLNNGIVNWLLQEARVFL